MRSRAAACRSVAAGRRPRQRRRPRARRRRPPRASALRRRRFSAKNYKAVVAYDGSRYVGSQIQTNGPTIQGELERALMTICREQIRIVLAGRTDAGVHATGQVMSFPAATELDGEGIRRGVNALLPEDIAIRGVEEVDDGFHARFSATGRTYEYRIRCAPQREPLERHREHWVPRPLDVGAMERAAARLVGRRDFASFAMAGMRTTMRTVRRAELHREGTLLRFEIEADAFLRGMVRAIVGTLLWIGRGTMSEERFAAALASGDRAQTGPSAPALGLCLIRVEYGGASRRSEPDADDEE